MMRVAPKANDWSAVDSDC